MSGGEPQSLVCARVRSIHDLRYTASLINIDPVVNGTNIDASQPIEADWPHPYENTASTCSVYGSIIMNTAVGIGVREGNV